MNTVKNWEFSLIKKNNITNLLEKWLLFSCCPRIVYSLLAYAYCKSCLFCFLEIVYSRLKIRKKILSICIFREFFCMNIDVFFSRRY